MSAVFIVLLNKIKKYSYIVPSTPTPPVISWLYQETFETSPGTDLANWNWYFATGSFDSPVPFGITGWGAECCKINDGAEAYLGSFPTGIYKYYLKFDIAIGSLVPNNVGSAVVEFEANSTFHLYISDPDGLILYNKDYDELISNVSISSGRKYTIELWWWENTTSVSWRLDLDSHTEGSGTYDRSSSLPTECDNLYFFTIGVGDTFYIDNIFFLDDWL